MIKYCIILITVSFNQGKFIIYLKNFIVLFVNDDDIMNLINN